MSDERITLAEAIENRNSSKTCFAEVSGRSAEMSAALATDIVRGESPSARFLREIIGLPEPVRRRPGRPTDEALNREMFLFIKLRLRNGVKLGAALEEWANQQSDLDGFDRWRRRYERIEKKQKEKEPGDRLAYLFFESSEKDPENKSD